MFATLAELRERASRARTYARYLPPDDEAVGRLLDYAAELEARAEVLEQQAGRSTAQSGCDAKLHVM
jgi:hypothetical protein